MVLTGVGPIAQADGVDRARHIDEPVPRRTSCRDDGLVALEDARGQSVLAQELPDILHRIELRIARGRQDRDDVGG
jgi:hypothetical protein